MFFFLVVRVALLCPYPHNCPPHCGRQAESCDFPKIPGHALACCDRATCFWLPFWSSLCPSASFFPLPPGFVVLCFLLTGLLHASNCYPIRSERTIPGAQDLWPSECSHSHTCPLVCQVYKPPVDKHYTCSPTSSLAVNETCAPHACLFLLFPFRSLGRTQIPSSIW